MQNSLFREATLEERRIFYREEWNKNEVPDFIRESIKEREFGFDHDGSGPKNRYNAFSSVEELERFLRSFAPYAAYSSVSYYEKPSQRAGFKKAELVFDIDAKDLPVKNCCEQGNVCERCLALAKDIVFAIKDVMEEDLAIDSKYMHYVYSGRGYHIRILDEDIMKMGDTERAYLLDYIAGSEMLKAGTKKNFWLLERGYARVFRKMIEISLSQANEDNLLDMGIDKKTAGKILRSREELLKVIKEKKIPKRKSELLEKILKINSSFLDAKVTVDVKRILRLPSTLHSKVSMKCIEIKNLESFDPMKHALPKFMKERN